jgi:hypothetical protein
MRLGKKTACIGSQAHSQVNIDLQGPKIKLGEKLHAFVAKAKEPALMHLFQNPGRGLRVFVPLWPKCEEKLCAFVPSWPNHMLVDNSIISFLAAFGKCSLALPCKYQEYLHDPF